MAYVDPEGTETGTTVSSGSGGRAATRTFDPMMIGTSVVSVGC